MENSAKSHLVTGDFPIDEILEIQSAILAGKQSIEETAGSILKQVLKVCKAEFGQILLLEGENLVVKASTSETDIGRSVSIHHSVSGLAVKENRSVRINAVSDFGKSLYKPVVGQTMQSELVVPLRIADRLIGVLNAESFKKNAFSQRQADILTAFGGLIAMAFLISEQNELKKRANEADKILSAGQIVHRLTGRAGAIRGWIEIMREIIKNEKPELENDDTLLIAMEDIESKALNLLELVNELKKQTSKPGTLVNIPSLLSEAIEKSQIPENIEVELSIQSNLPDVHSDPIIREVFWNMITNAVEAMPRGGKLSLTAKIDNNGEKVIIVFSDTGHGIPKDFKDLVFDDRFTTKSSGHGLGLWWSRVFVRTMGGEISLDSDVGKGAKFTVTLPVPKQTS
ncbi:MAG: ATP-binding protein [Chloroflexota bacterium]